MRGRGIVGSCAYRSLLCSSSPRAADRSPESDGGTTQSDGGLCVDIEPSAFDTSCNTDPDCIGIATGNICSGYNCICPGASIGASSQAAYDATLGKVPKGPSVCSCPALGFSRCIASQCVF